MKRIFTLCLLILALMCSCVDANKPTDNLNTDGTISYTECAIEASNETNADTEKTTEPQTIVTENTEESSKEPEPSEPLTEHTPDEPEPLFPEIEYSADGYWPKALMYHLVLEEPYNYSTGLFVRPADLEAQIQALIDSGYIFLFADEYGRTKEKSVVLTFDDGYVDNYTELLPILIKYNVKATVFIIGNLVNNHYEYLNKSQIKEMADSGLVQFGCHTMSHPYLTGLSDEQIIQEYKDCIALIKEFTGQDCRAIAYPYGDYDQRVTAITKQYFDYAYNSGYYPPDDDDLNYYISRYYIERGITADGLMSMIGG